MKKYILFTTVIVFLGMLITSCNKLKVDSPDSFDVTTSKLTYKVGDTVTFNFSGSPENIIFYSGEIGKRYSNINRTSLPGINKLVFQSTMQNGLVPPATSLDSLMLLISTNLAGYDSTSIVKATWTDITSRNTKWPTSLSSSYTTSDSIDISDFNKADKVNIAFRFKGKANTKTAQRKIGIQNLTLSNNLPDGTNTPLFSAPFLGASTVSGNSIAPSSSFQYTGWVQCSLQYLPAAWNVGTANVSGASTQKNTSGVSIRTSYPITFDPGSAPLNSDNDDWLITSAVNLRTVKPDAGVTIKSLSPSLANVATVTLKNYQYKFTTPGIYTVTFVALNNDVNTQKTVMRQIQITVTN